MWPEWVAAVGGEGAGTAPPALPEGDAWAGARERELSLPDAERQVRAEVRALGWRARYRSLDTVEPTATQCELRYPDGTEVPYGLGSGKGPLYPARVGAQFEALEHAFSGPILLDTLPVGLATAADLLDGPFAGDRAVQGLAQQPDAHLACLRHPALDGGPPVDVPLYLWAPWYPIPTDGMAERRARLGDTADYRPVLSYSVNTGCAIGATRDEALVHALNEWAERDALSLFLLRAVYDRGRMPGRIPREALPAHLRARLDRAAGLLDGPVTLLDLTTDLGIPVVLAYAPAPAGGAAHHGMGASLSGETAVERAVTELVQGELLARMVASQDNDAARRSEGPSERPSFARLVADHDIAAAVRDRLAGHPRLLACAHLDIADRLDEAPETGPPPETVPPGTPVAHQRAEAVARIAAAGHRVAARTLTVLEHGTTLVQVQCPGLERFQAITKGHLALPGHRGRQARARR